MIIEDFEVMITIKNLSKVFPNHKQALKVINLEIKKGETVALIGPNGAGKSTLLKIVLDILSASEGEVRLNLSKNKISFISIEMGLYDDMTVFDYLYFFAEIYGVNQIKDKINEFAEKLDFKAHLKQKIQSLSTGNMQKVMITRALINDPELLILDEPTNGLDVIISYEIRKIIRALQETGTTTIICSHLVEDLALSDRVIMMKDGKIIADIPNTQQINIYQYFIDGGES